jgi:hypothetical protein
VSHRPLSNLSFLRGVHITLLHLGFFFWMRLEQNDFSHISQLPPFSSPSAEASRVDVDSVFVLLSIFHPSNTIQEKCSVKGWITRPCSRVRNMAATRERDDVDNTKISAVTMSYSTPLRDASSSSLPYR